MKKRVAGILLCGLMLCTTSLAGCNLVERDMAKYLSTKVVEMTLKESQEGLENKITINKKELIEAYNTYGVYYVQYYNYTAQQAMDATIELLIRRKITIAQAEKFYPELSEKEKTFLWSETAKALDENYQSYLDKVLGKTDTTSKDEDEVIFKGYTKNAQPMVDEDGKLYIGKINLEESEFNKFTYTEARDYNTKEDKELIYNNFRTMVTQDRNAKELEAFDEYFKALKKSEEGQKLSDERTEVFSRETDRLYKVVYENFMIDKYEEYYTSDSKSIANLTAKQIVNRYTAKVRASYTKYITEEASTYDTDMTSGANNIFYYKEGNGDTKFFKVAHILFKFTDEQTEKYKEIEEAAKNGEYANPQEKQAALDSLYSQVVPTVRIKNEETGVYEEALESQIKGYESSAQTLRDYIANEVSKGRNDYEKADIFNEFIYKYNEDPGMMNPTDIYTIGVDKDGNAVSSFVKPFNDEGLNLYNGGNGNVGDISELVYTENGIHVMFYAGKIENLFSGINGNFELEESHIDALTAYRPNIMLDKSLFDTLYDELATDHYSIFENLQMNEIKTLYNIKVYTNSYKDLIKK